MLLTPPPNIEPEPVNSSIQVRSAGDILDEVIRRVLVPSAEYHERIRDERFREDQLRYQGWFSELLSRAGPRSRDYTFKNFQATEPYQRRCVQAILEWSDGGKDGLAHTPNLVLHGPVGTGKDHLAVAASKILCLKHGIRCGFLSLQDWFGEIRDAMNDQDREESAIIRDQVYPDVLIMSDPLPPFGNLTQHQATMFYRLVSARSSARKATIVTINVANDQEAYERIGAPTWNRLLENALVIHCNWPSHRQPRQRITNVKEKP